MQWVERGKICFSLFMEKIYVQTSDMNTQASSTILLNVTINTPEQGYFKF